MTKILIPIIVLTGLAVGLYLLLRGRRVVLQENASGFRLAILLAAAAIVGGVTAADAKGKHKKTCYKPISNDEVELSLDPAGSFELVFKRIEKLEKLHSQGKLTDAVYAETLAQIQEEIARIEISKKNEKELTKAEKKLVDLRRAMDGELVQKLAKAKPWKTLVTQARELRKYIEGKPSKYSNDKVGEALEALHSKGLIDAATRTSLATVLGQIAYHYDRSHSGKTCYKMSSLGVAFSMSRASLTKLFASLEGKIPTKKEFNTHLVTLATTLPCLGEQTEAACDVVPFPDTQSRISYVTTLSLLVEMSK